MKKIQKVLGLMLILVILFGLSLGGMAAEPTPWDGSIDTSWYDPEKVEFEIKEAKELAGLSAIVNGTADGITRDTFSGKTLKLTADMDLGSKTWTPIGGSRTASFAGIFDGNGKKIKNLTLDPAVKYQALFGYNKGMLKKLIIESGALVEATVNHHAGVTAFNYGTILNCVNKADVGGSANYYGGIAAINNNGYIINCANLGDISGTKGTVGGIAAQNTGNIISCYNRGANSGASGVGGIIGAITDGSVRNCYSTGAIAGGGGLIGTLKAEDLNGGYVTLANNYFLKTETINKDVNAIATEGTTVTDVQAKTMDESALKAAATTLGSSYTADKTGSPLNEGFPILTYQEAGIYPPEEGIGLKVTALEKLENGSMTVQLNQTITYGDLAPKDFTATITPQGGKETELPIKEVVKLGDRAELIFELLPNAAAAKSYKVTVQYKDGAVYSDSFAVVALNVVSLDSFTNLESTYGKTSNPLSSLKASVVLTLDSEPVVEPTVSDFKGSYVVEIDGEMETVSLPFSAIAVEGAKVTLSCDRIKQAKIDQDVVVRVAYQDGARKSTALTIPKERNWSSYAKKPAVGVGSAESPYQIGTAEELAWFAALVNGDLTDGTEKNAIAYGALTANIVLNDTDNWEKWDKSTPTIKAWKPIGVVSGRENWSAGFLGNFDGKGYTISGLYSAFTGEYDEAIYNKTYAGLFGCLGIGAVVKNVNLVDSYVYNRETLGGIANSAYSSILENCSTAIRLEFGNSLNEYDNVPIGGILGQGSYLKTTQENNLIVSGCYSTSTIIAAEADKVYVGGIVGRLKPSNQNQQYAGSFVDNCYFRGSIEAKHAENQVGGIVGCSEGYNGHKDGKWFSIYSSTLRNNYNAGSITAAANKSVAGIAYYKSSYPYEDTIKEHSVNNYYLQDAGYSDDNATVKSADDLKTSEMPGLLGSAYSQIPEINDGFPALKWQGVVPGDLSTASAPVFSLTKGGFHDDIIVSMETATEGATIYYTTDGSTPTIRNGEEYTEPFCLEGTVKAVAYKNGFYLSAVNSISANRVATPEITPSSKTLSDDTKVSISCGTEDAVIYYTTDGKDPVLRVNDRNTLSLSAKQYRGKINVTQATTIKVVAVKEGMLLSSGAEANFKFFWDTATFEPEKDGDTYLISNPRELAWFGALVNGTLDGTEKNSKAKAKLTQNIDMGDNAWMPMSEFEGIIDGADYAISNLDFGNDNNEREFSAKGFVNANKGTIKNLTFTGRTVDLAVGNVGMVAVSNSGTISNCHNEVDICTFGRPIGGITATNSGVIEFCSNSATIAGTKMAYNDGNGASEKIGGIAGVSGSGSIVRDCYNTGKITSAPGIAVMGQIVGVTGDNATVDRCYALGMLANSGRRIAISSDWSGWSGINPYNGGAIGVGAGLLAGGIHSLEGVETSTAKVTNSYFMQNLTLQDDQLNAVKLNNDNFKANFFHYIKSTSFGESHQYGFAGRQITGEAAKLLTEGVEYYVFYDVTNDKYIALELSGKGDADNVVIDAKDESAPTFAGKAGNYMTTYNATYHLYKIPADTKAVKFVNTEMLQDYSTEPDLTDFRATSITSDNKAAVMDQVKETWPAAYDKIVAAIAYANPPKIEEEKPIEGKVRVIIENTTFTEASQSADGKTAPAWSGTLVDTQVDINEKTTMMTAIVDAALKGGVNGESITLGGVESNYISSVNGLAAFDGKGAQSGWMGTLNNWFTNAGFAGFTAANGYIRDGVEIRVMYTNADNGGTDLGGSIEGDKNTKLKELAFTNGTLSPTFADSATTYTLTLDENAIKTTISYLAQNKAFQARAYLNDFKYAQWGYSSGDSITVKNGDKIYIGVGNENWESMQQGAKETRYTINVVGSGEGSAPTECIVSFDSQGGSEVTKQTVQSGSKLTEPTAPKKENYTFQGWYKEDTHKNRWNFELDTVNSTMTLYAKWEKEAPKAPYEEALGKAVTSVKTSVHNPTVGSTSGEWAVLALARHNMKAEEWYNTYLANLKAYVEEKDGKLSPSNKQYTEYSRVVLALTSLGQDATAFATGNDKVYDLVKPLLNTDTDGKYYPMLQGNNSIAFALLALNSGIYYPEEKVARATYIDALHDNQMDNGMWSISTSGSSGDIDTTAMVLQSLAPYYKDEAKLTSLKTKTTYAQLKATVEAGLVALKGKANENGDFGSSEAASQILVALSALEMNPQADGWTVVNTLLKYQDVSGGFKHSLKGEVNQMATEQAAYALVAYDRYMKEKHPLYDMTDVFTYHSPVMDVIAAINALPSTITINDKAAVEAARVSYDSLTKTQKELVSDEVLQKLTSAENAIVQLEKNEVDKVTAQKVIDQINALPQLDALTIHDKATVMETRTAFEALTENQKDLIPENTLKKLTDAEAKIRELENDNPNPEEPVVDVGVMTDVKVDDWFYNDVSYVLAKGIMVGTSQTTFGSDVNITRSQFVTILGRYAGVKDSSASAPTSTQFSDVNNSAYYASHVKWASENGVTYGTSATSFDPNTEISRQDMAAMMQRYAKKMSISLPEDNGSQRFADDGNISSYAKDAIYSMKAASIIAGKENNMFDPQGDASRAEASRMIHLLIEF